MSEEYECIQTMFICRVEINQVSDQKLINLRQLPKVQLRRELFEVFLNPEHIKIDSKKIVLYVNLRQQEFEDLKRREGSLNLSLLKSSSYSIEKMNASGNRPSSIAKTQNKMNFICKCSLVFFFVIVILGMEFLIKNPNTAIKILDKKMKLNEKNFYFGLKTQQKGQLQSSESEMINRQDQFLHRSEKIRTQTKNKANRFLETFMQSQTFQDQITQDSQSKYNIQPKSDNFQTSDDEHFSHDMLMMRSRPQFSRQRTDKHQDELLFFLTTQASSQTSRKIIAEQKIQNEDQIEIIRGFDERQKIIYMIPAIEFSWLEEYSYLLPTDTQVWNFPIKDRQSSTREDQKQEYLGDELQEFIEEISINPHTLVQSQYVFSTNILLNPNSDIHEQADYWRLNHKYHLDEIQKERNICVVVSGKNLEQQGIYEQFFDNILMQDYSKYHIYYIDDGSTDGTPDEVYHHLLSGYPSQLLEKITILKKKESVGSLANKHATIWSHCSKDAIVLDMEVRDKLIGKFVFQTLNSIYANKRQEKWVVYTGHIKADVTGFLLEEKHQPMKIYTGTYRHSNVPFEALYLKTYLASVYRKIPLHFLTKITEVDGILTRKYFEETNDMAAMFTLLQFAGQSRIHFLPELFYIHQMQQTKEDECEHLLASFQESEIRRLNSMSPLESIESPIKPIKKAMLGNEYFQAAQRQYLNCLANRAFDQS